MATVKVRSILAGPSLGSEYHTEDKWTCLRCAEVAEALEKQHLDDERTFIPVTRHEQQMAEAERRGAERMQKWAAQEIRSITQRGTWEKWADKEFIRGWTNGRELAASDVEDLDIRALPASEEEKHGK